MELGTMINKNINFSELEENEVIFFIRIKGKKSYFNDYYPKSFLNLFSKVKTFRTISEYKKDADILIDFWRYKLSDISYDEIDFIEKTIPIDSVIKRCRGLRAISYEEAINLIYKCSKYFIELFKNTKLKLIVSGVVDNYVMDLMFRFAKYYGIKVLGFTQYFLSPDYILCTTYGENSKIRECKQSEIEKVFEQLSNGKKSQLALSKKRAILFSLRSFIFYYGRYLIRYLIGYKLNGNLSYEYRFGNILRSFYKPTQIMGSKYFDKIKTDYIKELANNSIYVPLHYYPEATIDYWTETDNQANYYFNLQYVIKFFTERKIFVLIKEHPAFLFGRPIQVYKELKSNPYVILLSPFWETQKILENVKNVLVWNGSTGIESLMLNKCVYKVSENYYSDNKIPYYTDFGSAKPLSENEKKEILKSVLNSSLRND